MKRNIIGVSLAIGLLLAPLSVQANPGSAIKSISEYSTYAEVESKIATEYSKGRYYNFSGYPAKWSGVSITDNLTMYPDSLSSIIDFVSEGNRYPLVQLNSGGPVLLQDTSGGEALDIRTAYNMIGGNSVVRENEFAMMGGLLVKGNVWDMPENLHENNIAKMVLNSETGGIVAVPIFSESKSEMIGMLKNPSYVEGYVAMYDNSTGGYKTVYTRIAQYLPRYLGYSDVLGSEQLITNPAFPALGNSGVSFENVSVDNDDVTGSVANLTYNFTVTAQMSKSSFSKSQWYNFNSVNSVTIKQCMAGSDKAIANKTTYGSVDSDTRLLEAIKKIKPNLVNSGLSDADLLKYVQVIVMPQDVPNGKGGTYHISGMARMYFSNNNYVTIYEQGGVENQGNISVSNVSASYVDSDGKTKTLEKFSSSIINKPIKLTATVSYSGGEKDSESVNVMVSVVKNDLPAPGGKTSGGSSVASIALNSSKEVTLTTMLNSEGEYNILYNLGVTANLPPSMVSHYYGGTADYVPETIFSDNADYASGSKSTPDFVIKSASFQINGGVNKTVVTYPTVKDTAPIVGPGDVIKVGVIARNITENNNDYPVVITARASAIKGAGKETMPLARSLSVSDVNYNMNGIFTWSTLFNNTDKTIGGLLNNTDEEQKIHSRVMEPRSGAIRSGYYFNIENKDDRNLSPTYTYTANYQVISNNTRSGDLTATPSYAMDSSYINRSKDFHKNVSLKLQKSFLASSMDKTNRSYSEDNVNPHAKPILPLLSDINASEMDDKLIDEFKEVTSKGNDPTFRKVDQSDDSFEQKLPSQDTIVVGKQTATALANESPIVYFVFTMPPSIVKGTKVTFEFHVGSSAESAGDKTNNNAIVATDLESQITNNGTGVNGNTVYWTAADSTEYNTSVDRKAIQLQKTYINYVVTTFRWVPNKYSRKGGDMEISGYQEFKESEIDYRVGSYPSYKIDLIESGKAKRLAEEAQASVNEYLSAMKENHHKTPMLRKPYTHYYHEIYNMEFSYDVRVDIGKNRLSKDYIEETGISMTDPVSYINKVQDGEVKSNKVYITPHELDSKYVFKPVIAVVNPLMIGVNDKGQGSIPSYTPLTLPVDATAFNQDKPFDLIINGSLIDDIREAIKLD